MLLGHAVIAVTRRTGRERVLLLKGVGPGLLPVAAVVVALDRARPRRRGERGRPVHEHLADGAERFRAAED